MLSFLKGKLIGEERNANTAAASPSDSTLPSDLTPASLAQNDAETSAIPAASKEQHLSHAQNDVAVMYMLCQKLSLPTPEITFTEVPIMQVGKKRVDVMGFTAMLTLRLGERDAVGAGDEARSAEVSVDIVHSEQPEESQIVAKDDDERKAQQASKTVELLAEGSFRTKKEAKEAVAREAIEVLRRAESGRSAKAKSESAGGEENWIGLLNEYANATRIPRPTYQESTQAGDGSQAGTRFCCILIHPLRPEEPFDGSSNAYSTKKAARAAAARGAVLSLRETGHLQAEAGPVKKKARLAGTAHPLGSVNTTSGSLIANRDASSTATASGAGSISSPSEHHTNKITDVPVSMPSTGKTHAQHAAEHATSLSLPPPTYTITACSSDPAMSGYWDVIAVLPRIPTTEGGEQTEEGTVVGRADQLFGKKAAKEDCARQVVSWMEREEARRLESFDSFVWGRGLPELRD